MINRAEPRACGHSRGSRRLDTEPETERTAGPASNAAGDGCGGAQDDQAGLQPYWGKPAVRNEQRGWRKRGQDLMAICHNARKGRHTGSHWSKPVAPPLHSTSLNRLLLMLIILSPTICKGGDMSANISCIPWPYTYPYAPALYIGFTKEGTTVQVTYATGHMSQWISSTASSLSFQSPITVPGTYRWVIQCGANARLTTTPPYTGG